MHQRMTKASRSRSGSQTDDGPSPLPVRRPARALRGRPPKGVAPAVALVHAACPSAGAACWRHRGRRCGPALRVCPESERALPHAAAGRGVRGGRRHCSLGQGAGTHDPGGAAAGHRPRPNHRGLAGHPGLRLGRPVRRGPGRRCQRRPARRLGGGTNRPGHPRGRQGPQAPARGRETGCPEPITTSSSRARVAATYIRQRSWNRKSSSAASSLNLPLGRMGNTPSWTATSSTRENSVPFRLCIVDTRIASGWKPPSSSVWSSPVSAKTEPRADQEPTRGNLRLYLHGGQRKQKKKTVPGSSRA